MRSIVFFLLIIFCKVSTYAQVRSLPRQYVKAPARTERFTLFERMLIFSIVVQQHPIWTVDKNTTGNKMTFSLAFKEPPGLDTTKKHDSLEVLSVKYYPIVYSFVLGDSVQHFSHILIYFFDKNLRGKQGMNNRIIGDVQRASIAAKVQYAVPLFHMKGDYLIDTINHFIEFDIHARDTVSAGLQQRTDDIAILLYAYILLDHPQYKIRFLYDVDDEVFKEYEYTSKDILFRTIRKRLIQNIIKWERERVGVYE